LASRDLKNNISAVTSLSPSARTANATGATVDLLGYEAVAIEAIVGTITDGTHSLSVEHSDDESTWAAVPAEELQGSFSDLTSDTIQEVGYVGFKRYIRVNTTVATATTGGVYAVAVIRGCPRKAPV
jgi:hypothetical protein